MAVINRSALVPYSARQIFELVNNVEDYPQFLPWCSSSRVIESTPTHIEAELNISWKGISKSFTTRNALHPFERMEITLVKGPFRQLEGRWTFTPLGDAGCKITLALEFEFTGNVLDKLFQPIFKHIANSLVDAFSRRATEIYGPN